MACRPRVHALALMIALLSRMGGATEYRIDGFLVNRVYDQPANENWEPTTGAKGTLPVVPDSVNVDDFTLRRKSGKSEYSLFPGQMRDGVYRKLFAFRLDGTEYRDRLRIKFYSQRDAVWFRDLEDVYFQSDLVFANQPLLYFMRDGQWTELSSLPRKSVRLVLRSNPSGAHVIMNGAPIGVTPMVKLGLAEPYVLLRMEAPGLYAREEPISLSSDSEVVVNWDLKALLPEDAAPIGDTLPLQAWSRPTAPDLDAFEERYKRIESRLDSLEAMRARRMAEFDSLFPAFKAQGEFESDLRFKIRLGTYTTDREKRKQEAFRGLDSLLEPHRVALSKIAGFERPLQDTLLERPLVAPELSLLRYNLNEAVYPFRLKVDEMPLRFAFEGTLSMAPDLAIRLKSRPDSAHFTVRYWRLTARSTDGKQVFLGLDSLRCEFAGRPIRLIGSILPDSSGLDSKDYTRIRRLAREFDSSRQEGIRIRIEAEKRQHMLALKARHRRLRLYAGLSALGLAAGLETVAWIEKRHGDSEYDAYRHAASLQAASSSRAEVESHDRNALWLGGGGLGVFGIGLTLSLF